MVIDGKAPHNVVRGKQIANEIKEELKKEVAAREEPPTLVVFAVGENAVSEKFLGVKERFANGIGVTVEKKHYGENIDALRLAGDIAREAERPNRGLIVQLPLPKHFDTQKVLDAISPYADPDMLSSASQMMFENGRAKILPPVVGAIAEILERGNVTIKDKKVVVIGKGRLVGAPAAVWFRRQYGDVTVVDEHTADIAAHTKNADIIISGAGSPGIIKPDMIKDSVVLLDAGTSEAGGKVAGDASPACAEKASVFTPVPGGVGPITVAILFRNLLTITRIIGE